MIKVLHKVFKDVLDKLNILLLTLGELGSDVSHFIPEPRNLAEVTKLSAEVKMLG